MSNATQLAAIRAILNSRKQIKERDIIQRVGAEILANQYAREAQPMIKTFQEQTKVLDNKLNLMKDELEAVRNNTKPRPPTSLADLGSDISSWGDSGSEYQPSESDISQSESESAKSSKSQSAKSSKSQSDQSDIDLSGEEQEEVQDWDPSIVDAPLGVFVDGYLESDFRLKSGDTFTTGFKDPDKNATIKYDDKKGEFDITWFDGKKYPVKATPGIAFLLVANIDQAKQNPDYFNTMLASGTINRSDIEDFRKLVNAIPANAGVGIKNRKYNLISAIENGGVIQEGKGVRDKYKGKAPARLPAKQKGSGKKPDLIHSASNNTLKKRMEVLKGSILAGNNNAKTLNEMLAIADTLYNKKALSRKAHREAYSLAGID